MATPDLTPRVLYQRGDHVCTLYNSPDQQLRAAIDFVRGGLARRERCIYVCCDQEPEVFRAALRAAGVDVAADEARGALILLTKHDAHLKGGAFNAEVTLDLLHAAVSDALAAGFAGLCTAADMTWLLDQAPGSEHIAEYEARLNRFLEHNPAVGLCQYSGSALPASTLEIGRAHV